MRIEWQWRVTVLLLVLWFLSACGGGDEGGGAPAPPPTDGTTTNASFGQITGFGSMILNDITFDISDASLTADDDSVMEVELNIGEICLVQGSIDQTTATGIATSVVCDDVVEGPVTSIQFADEDRLVVMGLTVLVDVTTPTIFGDFNSLNDLVVGDIVEVHGFLDFESGEIQATRIELKSAPATSEVEVKGRITNFNGNDQFEINGLSVVFTDATEIEVVGGIADDKFVEVKGTFDAASNSVTASEVEDELENPLTSLEGVETVEIQGLISDFSGIDSLKVNGIPVNAQNANIEGGNADDLVDGLKVEVEGVLDDGILVAEELDIKRQGNIRFEVNVVDPPPTDTSLTVGGPGGIPITVIVNAATELKDETDDATGDLQLSDIGVGERAKIRAFRDADDIIATRLERRGLEDAEDDVKIRGPVDNFDEDVNDPSITIVGITFDISGAEFEDDEEDISQKAFFDILQANPDAVVEAVDEGPGDGKFDKFEIED